MKKSVRTLRMGIAALGIVLIAGACGSSSDDSPGGDHSDSTLTIATSGIRSMDPARQYDQPALWVNGLALEGLIKLDSTGKVQPALATKVDNPDPLTYVYTLREGVKFWNGAEVTTDDVVYSLTRYQDETAQTASKYASVDTIKATGPMEVTVTLKQADSSWQYTPAYAGQIVEKKFAEEHDKDLGGPGVLTMGTGPWQPKDFNSSAGMTFVKNDAWWGAPEAGDDFKESWKTVKLVFAAAVPGAAAVRAGDVDGVVGGDGTAFSSGSSVELTKAPTETLGYLTLLTDKGPLADVHVRRALAHLVDREAIIKSALKGFGDPATQMVSERVWTDLPEDEVSAAYDQIESLDYDVDAAKAELEQSEYDGEKIVAEVISTYPSFVRATEILKEEAAKIGLEIEIKGLPGAEWLTNSSNHTTEMTVSTYSSLSPDPNFYPNTLMRADGIPVGGSNYANLDAPGLDGFVRSASTAKAQSKEQLEAVVGALKANASQAAYIPIYTQQAVFAHDPKLSFDSFSQYAMGSPYPLYVK
ncbi:ABC transporter substrate-binding protein [Pimelobacter simplex]|uniref:ABC transporter substrate-binding protein n=1 Tax=Nocardioides simplex TaxID=2045 RepID=A0A7J5E346_NOCSI|nr:ABC transporter substrate-binding protein [Pimelobacter simplex]KAB2812686.1 ABC transporter substrate-binding protein [Pimelobacter simplex]